MRFSVLALLCVGVAACSDSSEPSDTATDTDGEQRVRMRSEIEGTWVGSHRFADGRAPTTMTLTLSYKGSGASAIRCGNRILSGGVDLQCITLYTMPLTSALAMADGTHASDAVTLSYENVSGLTGDVGPDTLSANVRNARLEGELRGAAAGTFVLERRD